MSKPESDSSGSAASFLNNAPWRKWPVFAAVAGGVIALLGIVMTPEQFQFSYLLAFMFFLSIVLGSLILIILHHLFDAGWSVPVRRVLEQLACLAPFMALFFVPIAFYASDVYGWMTTDPETSHALHAKKGYLNPTAFYVRAAVYFAVWTWLAFSFRKFSLAQDKDGAAVHTKKMRVFAGFGVVLYALTSTGAAIDWMKSLMYEWFSTMYGVWFFAASMWVTLGTLYGLTCLLTKGPLKPFVRHELFHNIGILMFAFTVFHAYISFSQYFIIWSGAIPEETFWYVLREAGSWKYVGYTLIFGHFLVPFLLLLRIDVKVNNLLMAMIIGWFWLMHFMDLSFNIMPAYNRDGFVLHLVTIGCILLMGGVLTHLLFKNLASAPIYPLKDPRLHEAVPHHDEDASAMATGKTAH